MPQMSSQYSVRILRSRAEIEALRGFWSSCRPGRDADLDFYLFVAGSSPDVVRPHVVALYDSDLPKALLAGRLEFSRVPVKLGYLSIPVPKIRVLQFVHGGWLGDTSDASAELLVRSIVELLNAGEADAAMLHYADLSLPLVRFARSLPHKFCVGAIIDPQCRRIYESPQSSGSFMASLSKKERYQQRKRAQDIAQDFHSNRIECFCRLDELDRLMDDAEAVARKSYQRGLGVGFSATPVIRSRLEFEARKGWLRAYVLYLNEHPSGFWIGCFRNGVFLSEYLAFDPAYAKYGPGMYLIVKVIEGLSSGLPGHHVERIDFGIGDAMYKEKLSNRHWHESTVYIFAPSVRAMSVNALRTAVGVVNRSAKDLMGKTTLLGRIKRAWRVRVTKKK